MQSAPALVLAVLALLGAADAVPERTQRIVGGTPVGDFRYPYMVATEYRWSTASAFGQSCGAVPERTQRIVGGTPVGDFRYPYMVATEYRWSTASAFGQSCGGALITSSVTLSAAHCYIGDQPAQWRVRAGTLTRNSGGIVSNLSRFLLHSGYANSHLSNDVALLYHPALPLGGNIGVASIAGNNYNLAYGTALTAMGWGAVQQNGPASNVLLHVQVYKINWSLCRERYDFLRTQPGYQNWPRITEAMHCAGILDQGGRDACQGDSGGPVAHAANPSVIYGVTSWGFGCAHNFYPGVNAHVPSHANWIVSNA